MKYSKKRKILFFVIMCFSLWQASADTFIINNIYYQTISDDEVEVTYKIFQDPTNYVGEIIIPDTVEKDGVTYFVTGIGNNAFLGCTDLTSVTVEGAIENIGFNAFRFCDKLTSIVFQKQVENIDDYAFLGCPFTSIQFADGLKRLGAGVFWDCTHLTSVELPNTVTDIGTGLFQGCSSLQSVTLSDQLTAIPDYTFLRCGELEKFSIPKNVTEIGMGAFQECVKLTSLALPDGLNQIGSSAFNSCIALESIDIPEGVSQIPESLFAGCTNLSSVSLPPSIENIGDFAFSACGSLASIDIPAKVRSIGNYAFLACISLQSLKVAWEDPLSITYGDYCFFAIDTDCIVYVPQGTEDSYRQMDIWNQFSIIPYMATSLSNQKNAQLILYPNPFIESLTVSRFAGADLLIMDVKGSILYSKTKIIDHETVPTSDWENGIYIVTIQKENKKICKKALKKSL